MEGHKHFDQHPQPPHFANAQDPTPLAVSSRPLMVKIFCATNKEYYLSIRNGNVILASASPIDPFQHWIKDTRHCTNVKDVQGCPAFALINKATGEAIQHSLGDRNPVRLVPFNPNVVDESVLWTESSEIRNGFRCIRMVNNISQTLDALDCLTEDGTIVINWPFWSADNQIWKMVPNGGKPISEPIHGASVSHSTTCEPVVSIQRPMPLTESSHLPTFMIFCATNEGYYLSIRDGKVILASVNPNDPFQHWIKYTRHCTNVKDEQGCPAFALINKATGEAIQHSLGDRNPVRLVPFNPNVVDESVLWTESSEIRNGFRCIRMVNNISLTLDALDGLAEDGTIVINWPFWSGDNQIWKMVPNGGKPISELIHGASVSHSTTCELVVSIQRPMPLTESSHLPTFMIFCATNEGYYLSIRDGKVILASANPNDPFQHWIKYTRHCTNVKDEQGCPAFALINKATGEAIQHYLGDRNPVRLVPFNPNVVDESMLWTESSEIRNGFRCICMVNNISLTLDALDCLAEDGTIVINWPFWNGDNQIWRMVPYGDEAIRSPIHGAPILYCTIHFALCRL